MNVRFTAQADADIVACYLYGFRNFGRDQADRYEQGLRHGRHYIVYLIERDHVLIVRVLRDEVDLTRHLGPAR